MTDWLPVSTADTDSPDFARAISQLQEEVDARAESGGSVPYVTGSGSPVGAVTPTAGKPLYIDVDAGTLYLARGAADVDWVVLGPVVGNVGEATGLVFNGQFAYLLSGDRDDAALARQAYFGDAYSQWNGHSQGVYWEAGPGEGNERMRVVTGATGQHEGILQDKDGNMSPAGKIVDLDDPTDPQDAATKSYVDGVVVAVGIPQGGPLSEDLAAGGFTLTGLADPTGGADAQAATKKYVDDFVVAPNLPALFSTTTFVGQAHDTTKTLDLTALDLPDWCSLGIDGQTVSLDPGAAYEVTWFFAVGPTSSSGLKVVSAKVVWNGGGYVRELLVNDANPAGLGDFSATVASAVPSSPASLGIVDPSYSFQLTLHAFLADSGDTWTGFFGASSLLIKRLA